MAFFSTLLNWISPRRWLTFFLALSALEGVGTVVYLLSIPADPKNSILLGFSARRLAVMGVAALGVIVLLGMAYLFERKAGWRERANALLAQPASFSTAILAAWVVIFLVGWALSWSPPYRFIPYDLYFKGLRPVIVWATVIAGQAGLLMAYLHYGIDRRRLRQTLQDQKQVVRASLAALAGIGLLWVVALLTRWGIEPDVVYWNNPGVPVLGLQVVVAWSVGVVTLFAGVFLKGQRSKKWSLGIDIILFVAIWTAAGLLWVNEPQVRSFFAPEPAPPNHAFYPISDAMTYDLAAQFALIGQGLENGAHTDKPFLSTFLVLVHLIAGQEFDRVANVQAILLALLPALLFVLGRALHSRPAGVLAGLLAAFKGKNAIASAWMVLSANPKVLTSEQPMGALLAVLTVLVVLWLQRPERRFAWGMLAAGVIGLGTLVRHNAWIFVPFFAVLSLFVLWREKRRLVPGALLLMIAFLVSIAPWMIRSDPVTGSPFYFRGALMGVVLDDRYVDLESNGGGENAGAHPAETLPEAVEDVPEADPGEAVETETPLPEMTATSTAAAPDSASPGPRLVEALRFTPTHFFHNLITSALVLPLSPVNDDLRTTITMAGSVWQAEWTSALPPLDFILLAVNLLCVGVGVGAAWSRWRWAGAIPLLTFAIYHLGTAAARTSGGRYIVPADWVVYLYFAIGVIQLSMWALALFGYRPDAGTNEAQQTSGGLQFRWGQLAAALGVLVLLGGAPYAVDQWIPRQYTAETNQAVMAVLVERGLVDDLGVEQAELAQFLESDDAVAWMGRGLYPRFYNQMGGVPARSAYAPLPYQRLIFTLIAPHGNEYGILPRMSYVDYFPNGSDVIVVGCRTSEANVLALIILGEEDQVYLRTPELPLECPSRAPLCDGNGNCI